MSTVSLYYVFNLGLISELHWEMLLSWLLHVRITVIVIYTWCLFIFSYSGPVRSPPTSGAPSAAEQMQYNQYGGQGDMQNGPASLSSQMQRCAISIYYLHNVIH